MEYTIKTIWGLAKSPELRLDKDSLYALVYRETKKESLKKLTKAEIKIDRFEWLDVRSCSALIEALKAMAGRM